MQAQSSSLTKVIVAATAIVAKAVEAISDVKVDHQAQSLRQALGIQCARPTLRKERPAFGKGDQLLEKAVNFRIFDQKLGNNDQQLQKTTDLGCFFAFWSKNVSPT